jgi:hypothetical protein
VGRLYVQFGSRRSVGSSLSKGVARKSLGPLRFNLLLDRRRPGAARAGNPHDHASLALDRIPLLWFRSPVFSDIRHRPRSTKQTRGLHLIAKCSALLILAACRGFFLQFKRNGRMANRSSKKERDINGRSRNLASKEPATRSHFGAHFCSSAKILGGRRCQATGWTEHAANGFWNCIAAPGRDVAQPSSPSARPPC